MKKILAISLIALFVFFASQTFADCWFNGNLYPTGTRINNKTCQPDGSWR